MEAEYSSNIVVKVTWYQARRELFIWKPPVLSRDDLHINPMHFVFVYLEATVCLLAVVKRMPTCGSRLLEKLFQQED